MSEQEIKQSFSRKADEYTGEEMIWILVDRTGCLDEERKAMFAKIAEIIGYEIPADTTSTYDKAQFTIDWNSGMSTTAMGVKYGISQDTARSRAAWLKKTGYAIILRHQSVSNEIAKQIIALKSTGLSLSKIGNLQSGKLPGLNVISMCSGLI